MAWCAYWCVCSEGGGDESMCVSPSPHVTDVKGLHLGHDLEFL